MIKPAVLAALIALAALTLAGCAPPKPDRTQLTALDEATKKSMTRTYKGFTSEQLIAAAENTLKHSDKDYSITSRRKDGFFASRSWAFFFFPFTGFQKDVWHIQAEGNKITAKAWNGGTQILTPCCIFTPGMNPSLSGDIYFLSPPLYDLFFDRLDYFLGRRSDWAPCAKVDKTKYQSIGRVFKDGNDPLCFKVKSQDPTEGNTSAVKFY